MKRLFLIDRIKAPERTRKLLETSAKRRGIRCHILFIETTNHTRLPKLTPRDMLYRISDNTYRGAILERLLLRGNPTTLYEPHTVFGPRTVFPEELGRWDNDIPHIKTIADLPTDRGMLKAYVKYLGGFPIVLKVSGGSHGQGVIKVDSFASLISIVDVLSRTGKPYMMRQFIDYIHHARLIVLGDRVVASIEYKKVKGDFRSNAGDGLRVLPKKFSTEIEDAAIRATHVQGWEFGGADILIDRSKKYYVSEVNFPCFFPRAQLATGIDISGMMVDYLLKKSIRKVNKSGLTDSTPSSMLPT